MDQQPPQQLSPDGKWRWDGTQWVAVEQAAGPPPKKRRPRALWIALGAVLLLVGTCTVAVVATAPPAPQGKPAGAKVAVATPTPTARPTPASTATPTPAATREPAPTPTPAAATPTPCDPGPDLIIREIVPNVPPDALALGSYSTGNNCEPTTSVLQRERPTGPGYCTTAALASDNPGYEDKYINGPYPPPPAPPLRNVILSVGDC